MSAVRIVRLPPAANEPAQRSRWTNAYAATARGDKTVMRPFAKLLWTLARNFQRERGNIACTKYATPHALPTARKILKKMQ